MTDAKARAAAEAAARASYGRLVAMLASRSRDIAAAEDALGEAFRAALETWPLRGVPDNPDAWLLTAARRDLGKAARHGKVRSAAEPALTLLAEAPAEDEMARFGDPRLALMFAAAHPAISPDLRTALMLQVVLRVEVPRIASAFLVSPTAMAQRLVRAKARLRAADAAFEVPEPQQMPERLGAVLEAVYAAFGKGRDAVAGAEDARGGLIGEALHLGRLLVAFLPEEAEAQGLLALMLHVAARIGGAEGRYVPLDEQDCAAWDAELIAEAEACLGRAAACGAPGRFQTEAAIQSLHVWRRRTGAETGLVLMRLYDTLIDQAPSIGALVSRAMVRGGELGAAEGLACLDAIEAERVTSYQPFWAARAHLLRADGQEPAARECYGRAIGLTEDPAVKAWLMQRRG